MSDLTPCPECGYPFDQDQLGIYGCPNCLGEGLEPKEKVFIGSCAAKILFPDGDPPLYVEVLDEILPGQPTIEHRFDGLEVLLRGSRVAFCSWGRSADPAVVAASVFQKARVADAWPTRDKHETKNPHMDYLRSRVEGRRRNGS